MKKCLALDLGGTKTHIALVNIEAYKWEIIKEHKYKSQEAASLEEIILDFNPDCSDISAICVAVAGPVINYHVDLTNLSWDVDRETIRSATGVQSVYLLNDLEASAISIPLLEDSDKLKIYDSPNDYPGNIAVIAPGTGLGEAGLYFDGERYHPFATEGGHCDFSPRDSTDVSILMYLQHKYGHVSWERLVSGMGIVNIFDFLRTSATHELDPDWEARMLEGDIAANVSKAAIEGHPIAIETMEAFVRYLAIEASNIAMKFKSMGGIYIGGGIIPKIWNENYHKIFLEHFFDVGRMKTLLQQMDVIIITDATSVLEGTIHYLISKV